jgi:hypothetical protein
MKRGFLILLLLTGLSVLVFASEKRKPAWSTDLKPGDKVCLYDIGQDDPLVGHDSYSLEYWYRSPAGNQRARRQLRPSVRKLLFKILWPGVKVSGADEDGNWYEAALLVIKGGHESESENPKLLRRDKNTLILEKGRSWAANWQVLKFTQARFRKKPRLGNCYRKYRIY